MARQKQTRFLGFLWGTLVVLLGTLGIGLLCIPFITIQGVPATIVLKFLVDQPARTAYFARDKQALHDRLQELNIEEDIKDHYRPQFQDEEQLDQHIHQIFYEVSGYVGIKYVVNTQGVLIQRNPQFERWVILAQRAGIIANSHYADDGTGMVTSPQGITVRFDTVAPLYPPEFLRQIIKSKKQKE